MLACVEFYWESFSNFFSNMIQMMPRVISGSGFFAWSAFGARTSNIDFAIDSSDKLGCQQLTNRSLLCLLHKFTRFISAPGLLLSTLLSSLSPQ